MNRSHGASHTARSADIPVRLGFARTVEADRNVRAPLASLPVSGNRERRSNPWLHRFTLLTALATLGLIGIGGLVTSHGAGMAVPDWPNTYGYNMFLFPVSQWMGGIFYEHTHRLAATLVGLLTAILALWLWTRETQGRSRWAGGGGIVLVLALMGVRQLPVYIALALLAPVAVGVSLWQLRRYPGELRWWGVIAFAAVILQGVLGGLRVVWLKDPIGIIHAALAQGFFVLTCMLAMFTSKWWEDKANPKSEIRNPKPEVQSSMFEARCRGLSLLLTAGTFLVFCQLILGAVMRHQHAGLAIPDFPLAYGKLWPATDAGSVALYNQQRLEIVAVNPITRAQILLQMGHRLMAVVILGVVTACAWLARRRLGAGHYISRFALLWLGLIMIQALLGAETIWSNKAADIATAHVVVGALSLALGAIIGVVLMRTSAPFVDPINESQRDSGSKPRVARNELPWETSPKPDNPNGVEVRRLLGSTTPLGLKTVRTPSQGSSFLATLGWRAQSLWDCRKVGLSSVSLDSANARKFPKALGLTQAGSFCCRREIS